MSAVKLQGKALFNLCWAAVPNPSYKAILNAILVKTGREFLYQSLRNMKSGVTKQVMPKNAAILSAFLDISVEQIDVLDFSTLGKMKGLKGGRKSSQLFYVDRSIKENPTFDFANAQRVIRQGLVQHGAG